MFHRIKDMPLDMVCLPPAGISSETVYFDAHDTVSEDGAPYCWLPMLVSTIWSSRTSMLRRLPTGNAHLLSMP